MLLVAICEECRTVRANSLLVVTSSEHAVNPITISSPSIVTLLTRDNIIIIAVATGNRNSVVSTTTGSGLESGTFGVRVSTGARYFSFRPHGLLCPSTLISGGCLKPFLGSNSVRK